MVSIVTGSGLGLQSSSALGLGDRGKLGNATLGQTGEQVYVNAATGNLVIQDRDQMLLGQGLNGAVYRAYNSLGQVTGDNWRPGGTRSVNGLTGTLNTAGSTLTLTDWDGSTTVYQYDVARGTYVSTAGAGANVTFDTGAGHTNAVGTGARPTLQFDAAANTWQWRDGQGKVTETYDASHQGRLVSRQDKDGNTVSYVYNAAGQLSQVVTAGGDVTNLDYNAAGQLTALRSLTHEAGGRLVTSTAVRYAYDTQGRLSQVIVDLSPDDNSIADGRVYTTTYTYDGTSSQIASITQSDGAQVSFTYVQVGAEYRVATIAERGNGGAMRVTKLSYDTAMNQTTVTDPLGYQQILSYDAQGRLTSIRASSTADGQWEDTRFTYDDNGNLFIVQATDEKNVYLRYDAAGNLISQSDTSADINRTYGANNELLTELVYDKNDPACPWRTTRYVYDTSGHLRFVVSSEGRVTEFRYNAAGQQTSEIRYTAAEYYLADLLSNDALSEAQLTTWLVGIKPSDATRTDMTYDYRGNLASVTRYAQLLVDGSGDVAGEISQSRYIYDPAGRLLQHIVGPVGQEKVEQFVYDGLGRLLQATNFAGIQTLYQYDDAKHTVAITYSNGLTRTSTYNAAGELIAVADSQSGKVVSQIRNYYDANGRLRMTTDANGQNTHYLRNGRGQVVAKVEPDGTLTEYVYDQTFARQLRTVTYRAKLSATQLASLVRVDGSPLMTTVKGAVLTLESSNLRPQASSEDRSVWAYYLNNWLDHTVDSDGVVTQTQYDPEGRVIAVTVFANRVDITKLPALDMPAAAPGADRITRYFYDGDGLLVGQMDPAGYVTEYRYNGAGQKTETIRYTKPTAALASQWAAGTLTQLRPASDAQDIRTRYMYDGQGRLTSEVDGDGYVTRYRYDAFGNVIERTRGQRIDASQLTAPQQMTLQFTAQSNRYTAVFALVDGVVVNTFWPTAGKTNYSVSIPNTVPLANHAIEFRYNTPGDGVSITDVTLEDQRGQPVAAAPQFVAGTAGGVSTRFTLDLAAALAQASTPGELERTAYAYDAMGRLIERTEFSSSGNATAQYRYDDQGNLIAETAQNRTLSYRYDAQGRLIGQLTGEGSAQLEALGTNPTQAQLDAVWSQYGVTYGYDAAGNRVSQTDANGHTTHYYYDVAGRLSHIVNPAGEVVAYEYATFGDLTKTIVYATRLDAGVLANLTGGTLDDALRTTFGALYDDQASITRLSYSNTGRLTQRTDARGNKTDYTYNTFGDQTSVTQDIDAGKRTTTTFDHDRVGQLIRQTTDAGGLNLITQAIYDAFGRPTQTTDANGVVRSQQYDRNGNVIVLTDGNRAQTKLTYDAFGNVLTSTDRTGATTTYDYSAFNREITVTTPEGVKTTTSYDALGQLIALTDGRGNTTTYRYDLDGNLVETTDPSGAKATTQYNNAGQLIETTDARGIKTVLAYDAAGRVLTRTVDPTGLKLTTTYAYDAKGQLISTTDPSGTVTQMRYDLNGQQAAVVVDPDGMKLTTSFIYDASGRVLTITEGEGSAAPRITRNTYDNAGCLVSTSVDPEGLNLTTRYAYDAAGNVVTTIDPGGGVTRYAYDEEGHQTWSVGPTGAAVEQVFDAEGRLVLRRAYATPLTPGSLPNPLKAGDLAARVAAAPQDQTTRYAYDADGRIAYTVNGLGHVTGFTYDASGNVIATTAYAGAIPPGGPISKADVRTALQSRSAALVAEDRATRVVFDAANRAVFRLDALGNVTHNRYDDSGNLIERTEVATSFSGQPTEAALMAWWYAGASKPEVDRVTNWTYDAAGRLVGVSDAEGYITFYQYEAGRLAQTGRYSNAATADVVATLYRYDSAGRVIQTDSGGMGRYTVTHYTLDALGRAIDTTVAYGTDQAVTTRRDYDAAGRTTAETRAWGTAQATTTRTTYDAVGRVTATTDPNQHTTYYGYDAQGNRTSVTDPLGSITRTGYDAFGNAVKVTDARGNSTYFYFDAANRNVLQVSAVGGVIATEYSASGQPTKVTQFANAWTSEVNETTPWTSITPTADSARDAVTKLSYDRLDRLIQSTDAEGYSEKYSYDAFGNRIGYTNKVGGTFAYTYDKRGLMLSETLPITSGGKPVVNRFEYDARGNRTTVIEAAGLPEQRTTRITYDAFDREVSRVGDAVVVTEGKTTKTITPTETHAYDARGNLIRQTDANGSTTAWYYDAADRRIAQVGPDGAYTVWEYDPAGNLTAERRYAELVSATDGATPPGVPENPANTRETHYTYDAANRLTASTLLNVATGALAQRNGEYIISEGSIVRRWEYDALGNPTVTIDGNGNRSVTLWDPRGPWKTMEIDAMGYATRWVHDAQGNVLQEIRYASPYQDVGSIGASTNPDQLAQDWPTSPEDRITTYTWDRNGRMTSEARQNVAYAEVDALGRLTERMGEARTAYVYDGEGHLLKRTDANNQQREFTYDVLGRQTAQRLPEFVNHLNQLVRSTTEYEYDGLNNVTKETRKGGADTADQVDTYVYGAGGRLMSKTNSAGLKTDFSYDAAGNTTLVSYRRISFLYIWYEDKTYISYDAANREVSRYQRSDRVDVPGQFTQDPITELRYNAFGDIIGRRTRLEASTDVAWQEYAEYNNAGNVIRTNFNDGISHVYMYDRNGNATLQVESMAADLRTYTINDILKDLPLNQTFTGYDARNQVTEIRQPKVLAGAPQVTFSAVEIHIDGGKFANTQLSVGGWLGKPQDPVVVGPALGTENAGLIGGGAQQIGTSVQFKYWPYDGNGISAGYLGTEMKLDVKLPNLKDVYGAYEIEARATFTVSGHAFGTSPARPGGPFSYSGTATSSLVPGSPTALQVSMGQGSWAEYAFEGFGPLENSTLGRSYLELTYTVDLYLRSSNDGGAPKSIGSINRSTRLFNEQGVVSPERGTPDGSGKYLNYTTSEVGDDIPAAQNILTVANGTLPTGAQSALYYRLKGSTDGFQPLPKDASSTDHSYRTNIGGLSAGSYELVFIATSDGSDGRTPGTLLRRDAYLLTVPEGTASTVGLDQRAPYAESGFQYNETGTTLWQAPGTLNLYAPYASNNALADSVRVRLRDPKTNAIVMGDVAVNRNAAGAFALDFSGVPGGNYVVEIDLLNAAGERLDTMVSTSTLGMGTPTFDFRYLRNKTTSVTFHSQDAAATYLRVSWMQEDDKGELIKKYTIVLRNGAGDFVWDTTADGLLPDPQQMYTYEIDYTAFDATDKPISMGRGEITIGTVGEAGATLTGSENIPYLEFKPISPQGNVVDADVITLYYRPAPRKDEDYDAEFKTILLARDADGKFLFNAAELPINAEFEYRYTARDAAGEITLERSGFFLTGTRSFEETNTDIQYIIEQTAKNKDMTIDRNQLHNAFGEVSVEIDGRGSVTTLTYNTNGNLVLKQEPEVSVTLANGFITKVAPQTRFYYDRTGNLVGLKDANGHLSTQQWNYGTDQPAVAKSWDAQGNAKVFQFDERGNLRIATDELNRRTDYAYDRGNRLIQVDLPADAVSGKRTRETYGYDEVGNRLRSFRAELGRDGQYYIGGPIGYGYDQSGRIIYTRTPAGRTTAYEYEWVEDILGIGGVRTGGWRKTTTVQGNGGAGFPNTLVDDTDQFGRLMRHEDRHDASYPSIPRPPGRVTTYTYNYAGLLSKQTSDFGQHIEYEYYSHGRVRSIKDLGTGTEAQYEYDGNGNRTYESFRSISGAYVFSQAYVQYDTHNRVAEVKDLQYTVRYEYDAVGNRRRMGAEYHDPVDFHKSTQEYWYEYDSENRFTVTMGQLSGGKRAESVDDDSVRIVIGEGGQGVQLGYNAAGERSWARYASDGRTERYEYDTSGNLVRQYSKQAGAAGEVLIQQRVIDAFGRATQVTEWDPAGSGQELKNLTRTYDFDGLVLTERDNLEGLTTRNTYSSDGILMSAVTTSDDPNGSNFTTTYKYEWWDGPKQKSVTTQGTNPNAPGWKPGTSTYNYDVNGNLKAVLDDGGGQAGNGRAFIYWTDQQGQVLRRDEVLGARVDAAGQIVGGTANRQHSYYYLNGQRIGNVGNDGIEQIDYVQELAGKLGKAGDNDYKIFNPVAGVDFDENFLAINGTYPGLSPTVWTVREGDTLQAIASAMWGDETLWYILADANGLKSTDTLKAGQLLRVPNKVTNIHNTAHTFKPYDPGRAIGNTQPTLPDPPPPPGKGGCGGLVAVIAVIAAVVVTYFSYGTLSGPAATLAASAGLSGTSATVAAGAMAGAAAGAAGATASQGVMIAGGEQKGFNWKGIGMGAVGGAVTGGIMAGAGAGATAGATGATGTSAAALSIPQTMMYAGLSSAVTQGIGIATGLQDRFDWKGVAVSAIAAGVGASVRSTSFGKLPVVGNLSAGLAAGAASVLARGGSLGRNVGAITADAIGATIGNMIVDRVQAGSIGKTAATQMEAERDARIQQMQSMAGIELTQSQPRMAPADLGQYAQGLNLDGQLTVYGANSGATSVGYNSGLQGTFNGGIVDPGNMSSFNKPYGGEGGWGRYEPDVERSWVDSSGALNVEIKGGPNVVQAPTGSLSTYGGASGIQSLPLGADDVINDPWVANTPGGALLGLGYGLLDNVVGNTAALFRSDSYNPISGRVVSPGQLQRTKEDLVINLATLGIAAPQSGAAATARSALNSEIGALRRIAASNAVDTGSAARLARIDELAEANAYRRLQEIESSVPSAHFLEKHGAQTTLQSQLERAQFGRNPTTGVVETYPNGKPKIPSSATRFLSNRDQLNAIDRAQNIYRVTGDMALAERPIKFDYLIGEGYRKSTLTYGNSYSAQVWFRKGQVNTAFPIWGQ